MSIEATISNYYNSLAAMNPQGWLDSLADDAAIYDPVGKPALNPEKDSEKLFTILTNFYSKFEIERESLFIVNNEVAVKWKMIVVSKNGKEGLFFLKFFIQTFHRLELTFLTRYLAYNFSEIS